MTTELARDEQPARVERSRLRYLVPNLVTASSIAFGLLAIQQAVAGRPRGAVWWALTSTLTDKLDGTLARRLHAVSGFGVQLDSLADFLSFGVAPATVFYAFFEGHAELGWASGPALWALRAIMMGYVICAAARLARFNVIAELPGMDRMFFGVPTTFTFAVLGAWFAFLLKYGDPAWTAAEPGRDWRLLGELRLDGVMRIFPLLVALGGLGMVSMLRVPKFGKVHFLPADIYAIATAAACYVVVPLRVLPEYLAVMAVTYVLGMLAFHFLSRSSRDVKLPPLFV
jgi:CDP-diacylglycerol--serine O-phosphatidyltransferase